MKKTIILFTLFGLSACIIAGTPHQSPLVDGIVYLSDYESLQDAVTAVPQGGTIIIPRGIWEGDAVVPAGKYVHIQGVSPAVIGQAPPLGSGQWDWLLENYPDTFLNGSILRGHITATGDSATLSMTNVIMIGHGEGMAVELGTTGVFGRGAMIDNVSIGNYEIGIKALGMYNLTINKMQLHGVGTGLIIRDGNLNRLHDVDIMSCTLGADLKGQVLWEGGSVQTCTNGVDMFSTNAYMSSVWFEDISGYALTWDGYGGDLRPNFYAGNSGAVIVDGWNNTIDFGWVNSATLSSLSQSNVVTISGGPLVNDGWNNRIIDVSNFGE